MNAFDGAKLQLSRATALRPLHPDLSARLEAPEREIKVSIPVRMDDGSTKVFEGYRVQYSSLRGPYKGGIRYHAQTDISEVKALAFWMTMKCAIAGIAMGGGKGGITVDPKTLSKTELEALSRGWVRAMYPILGPERDVPAPDVNTTPEIMSWMADEYEQLTGDARNATFTGKPLEKGGSEGRTVATGAGGFYVFDALRESLGVPKGGSVAIQGMGNVGANAAHYFRRHGYVVVAMSDSRGGLFSKDGLPIERLEQYKKEKGSLEGFPGPRYISNDELLEVECDLLVPAALEHQITSKNAGKIRAKAILELANGPTTTEADDILFERGIPVVPDVLANSGGVVVSTFEWEQNLKKEHWGEKHVLERLRELLEKEANSVLEESKRLKTDLRRAAFCLALERLEGALEKSSR